jgi:8-oxo-dGTP pyrophosphatase MutT (NUDIX family)
MISLIVKLIPKRLLLTLYKRLPIPRRLRDWIVWRGNSRFLVGVLGIILDGEGKVLLLSHTYRKQPWGLPGGWMVYEEPKAGLKRELREETGFTVDVGRLVYAEYLAKPHRVNLYFIGRYIGGAFVRNEEISNFKFVKIDELPSAVPQNIVDLIKGVVS